MSMYQVAQHRTGKNATRSPNGDIWETGHGYPAWEPIWQGRRRKADAIAAADNCPIHATVVVAYTAHVIYNNGKEPGSRIRDLIPTSTPEVLKNPFPTAQQAFAQSGTVPMTPNQIVRRVVALARQQATSGNHECARRLWRTAEWHACRCGGISGTVPGGGIVLDDGFVAWSPSKEQSKCLISRT